MGKNNSNKEYKKILKQVKIPILVLDQKWHQIFADIEMPAQIKELEEEVQSYLLREAAVRDSLREWKKVKATLLGNVLQNMDGAQQDASALQEKKLEADRRLIQETNEKIEELEDELLELPRKLYGTNEKLMVQTMEYCYEHMKTNASEIEALTEWIARVREELKHNIIVKQEKEEQNQVMYHYLHDVFGAEYMNLFDVKYGTHPEETDEA